jgi:hypothetical protein
MDFTRLTLSVGVDKHGAAALTERFGKFGGELMAGDNFGVLAHECLGEQTAGVPANRVIAPQRITVADNQSPKSRVRMAGVRSQEPGVRSKG